jgi:HAMP domain-containing protein
MTVKIHQIGVTKYGPLEDVKIDISPGFQCIFGPNESGKTLIIDAILKMVLPSKHQTPFGSELQRVHEEAHGWIVLDVDGEAYEITDSRDIARIDQFDSESLRDLLVVRNSDLRMLDQAGCLERATDLMMGLRTGEIRTIQEELRNRGQLTETRMEISSAGGNSSAGNQLRFATSLLESIDEYLSDLKEDEIAQRETEIINLAARLEELREEERELTEARKLRDLQRLKEALSQARAAKKELENYPEEFEREAGNMLAAYEERLHDYDRLEDRKKTIYRLLLAVVTSMVILGLVTILIDAGTAGFVQSAVSGLLFVALLAYWVQISRRLERIDEHGQALVRMARKQDPTISDVDSAAKYITKMTDEIKGLENKLRENIGAIKNQLSTGSVDKEEVLRRAELAIQEREKGIDKRAKREYNEADYDKVKRNLLETEQQLKRIRKENEEHNEKLRGFDVELRKLRFDEYLGRKKEYSPASVDSLRRVREEVHEFVSVIKNEAEICRKAVEIFDTLALEEQKKVARLLSENTRASEIFSEITGGRYSQITHVPEEGEQIRVVRSDGSELKVLSLSRGTKDQMYLSIRLALAESILRGESGFFIFDDPFLASDLERRDTQTETLEKMIQEGWQILYFTANKNLAEEFKSRFGQEYVTLGSLP